MRAKAMTRNGPDFLCIGQQRAGTGWLYDALQYEPGFWMPPIKELHFFDKKFPVERLKTGYVGGGAGVPKKLVGVKQVSHRTSLDERDVGFIEHAMTYKRETASIEWYKRLFAPKEDLVSGDITPAYSTLRRQAIDAIAKVLPGLRLVLLLRDPVSRSWSQFNMRLRRQIIGRRHSFDEPSADVVAAFQQHTSAEEIADFLGLGRVRRKSFPTVIYGNWSRQFDPSQISVVFFEDIAKDPGGVIQRIRRDLGLPGRAPAGGTMPVDFNRKATQLKREMTDDVRAVLVDAFRDEILRCAELFGGPAEEWPRRYGIA